jgi:hypothetical protein
MNFLRRYFYPIPFAVCIAFFLVQLLINGRYGLYHDELYFIDCARHLAWGYVDHPPLVPWITWLAGNVFGFSSWGIRFPLACALTLNAYLTVVLATRLGGGPVARYGALYCFLLAPVMPRATMFLNIPTFEMTFYLLIALTLLTILQRDAQRLWLLVGALAGLSLLNKHTTLFFGFAMALGLLFTPQRKALRQPWIWLGGLIALLIVTPNLLWQYHHEWATLEFIQNLNQGTMRKIPQWELLLSQLLFINPFNAAFFVGAVVYFRSEAGKPYRLLGWIVLLFLAVLLVFHAKHYYFAPLFPLIMAAGSVTYERWMSNNPGFWLRRGQPALACLLMAPFLVALMPLLPKPQLLWYEAHIFKPVFGDTAGLMRDYYNQMNWEDEVVQIADIFHALPEEEQGECAIINSHYGMAGSINYWGGAHGLPDAQSGNNNYYLWGKKATRGAVAIVYGYDRPLLDQVYGEVTEVGRTRRPFVDGDKTDLPIYVCRNLKMVWSEAWPLFKRYI